MKKLLCAIMSAIILSTTVFAVSAADVSNSVSATPDEAQEQITEGYCDGFYYSLYKTPYFENFSIKGYDGNSKDLVVPSELDGHKVRYIDSLSAPNADDSTVESVTISDGISQINRLFSFNSHLKHVYIDSKIMTFEMGGKFCDDFWGCPNLESIELCEDNENYSTHDGVLFDKSVNALVFCPEGKQGSYKIPDSVTWIYDSALNNCKNITELIFPKSITAIDSSTCSYCENLTRVEFGDNLQSIGSFAFSYCSRLNDVVIPTSVHSIGDYAFLKCDSLTEVSVPDSVTTIGERAFGYCDNLKTITLGKGVSELGEYFVDQYSSNLENVFVNEGNEHYVDYNGILFSIDNGELLVYPRANKSITLTVPDGITTLPDIENHTLTEINIHASVTMIGNINERLLENINVSLDNPHFYSINGVLFSKDTNEMLCYPPKNKTTELTIPDGIVKTCKIASEYLSKLNIPSSVTELGNINCKNLENINVSNDNQAFCSIDGVLYNKDVTELISIPLCTPLEELVVPETVELINSRFDKNKHLKNVYLNKNCTQVYGNDTDNLFPEYESVLENVFVADGNPKYYSLNGVLIGRDSYAGTTGAIYNLKHDCVILYPQKNKNKTFRFPENTIIISLPQYNLCYLEDVYIPASAEKMLVLSFSYCRNLKNIYVDGNNSAFCDIDGVLYSKDKKTLLRYPQQKAGKTYEVCKDTEILGDNSFYGNETLTNITIPDNIKRINWAFNSCSNLKEITVSKFTKEMSGLGWSCTDPRGHGTYTKNDDLVIRGYTNSPAETYAKKNGFTFISLGTINKLGDSNSDGVVNIIDATTIQRYLAEYEVNFSENEEIASDTNGDGHITISDVTEIQRFIADLPSVMSES